MMGASAQDMTAERRLRCSFALPYRLGLSRSPRKPKIREEHTARPFLNNRAESPAELWRGARMGFSQERHHLGFTF